jgi:Flp pilus assembly protein TadG
MKSEMRATITRSIARSKKGMAALELAMTCGIIVAMSLVCLDVCFLVVASSVNDRACRDAARAASQQDSAAKAQDAARAALMIHRTQSNLVGQPTLVPELFSYVDNGGDPDIPNPTVTVGTQTTVRMPVPVFLFGVNFGSDSGGNRQSFTFRKVYTFPIVKFNLDLSKVDPE